MNLIFAILLIAVGSFCAASFYVPLNKIKAWSWETFWAMQGLAAWIIAPWVAVCATTPSGELMNIVRSVDSSTLGMTIFFGALWGVGGLTFGLSIRYLGVALGQSIALGFCAAFGTLLPPIIAGQNLFASSEGIMIVLGVIICLIGITTIGYAGSLKNKGLTEGERKAAVKDFALKKGLIIAVFAGLMSAAMNFGYSAGVPIDKASLAAGVNSLYQSNITLAFILIGGFVVNISYCLYLGLKNKSLAEYGAVSGSLLVKNLGLAFLGGFLWFLQFHIFGMGKSMLEPNIAVFAWSILMALNVAIANLWGIALKEWKGVSKKTMVVLIVGIIILVISTFVVAL